MVSEIFLTMRSPWFLSQDTSRGEEKSKGGSVSNSHKHCFKRGSGALYRY